MITVFFLHNQEQLIEAVVKGNYELSNWNLLKDMIELT